MPSTNPRRWAGWLLTLSAALFGAFFALIASGQRGGDTFFSNLWLSATIIAAAASALVAGCFGGLALRRGDRSAVAMVAVAAGTVVALWSIAELAFPH